MNKRGGAVVGVAVERIGQRYDGRPRLVDDPLQLAPQIVAVVGHIGLQRLIIVGRIGGDRWCASAAGLAPPPVRLQQPVEPAVGEPQHLSPES